MSSTSVVPLGAVVHNSWLSRMAWPLHTAPIPPAAEVSPCCHPTWLILSLSSAKICLSVPAEVLSRTCSQLCLTAPLISVSPASLKIPSVYRPCLVCFLWDTHMLWDTPHCGVPIITLGYLLSTAESHTVN